MKTNEVPEKLYCVAAEGGYYLTTNKSEPPFTEAVEYTRTDVFIEKACIWMKESITNNPECNRIISKKGVITIGSLIEDFKEYLKK